MDSIFMPAGIFSALIPDGPFRTGVTSEGYEIPHRSAYGEEPSVGLSKNIPTTPIFILAIIAWLFVPTVFWSKEELQNQLFSVMENAERKTGEWF
jgi:hypothetical protein